MHRCAGVNSNNGHLWSQFYNILFEQVFEPVPSVEPSPIFIYRYVDN